MDFGTRIAYLRNERNMSQADAAKALGVSKSTVGMWESGRRKITNDKLVEVADFFGVSTDYLLGYRAPEEEEVDLRKLLTSGSMKYGGKEMSERSLRMIADVIQTFMDEGGK